jgi:hypothetical protein
VRANTILFLAAIDVLITGNLMLRGLVDLTGLLLALTLVLPYALGTYTGQALFHPDLERVFRGLAYAVIAGAILTGLPIFG